MLDRARMKFDPDDASLGAALRGLPAAEAPADLWSSIAGDLSDRRTVARRRGIAVPLAAAAALLAAVLLWLPSRPPVPDAGVAGGTSAATTADAETARLRARSQRIEQWLAALPAASQQDGRNLMATVETEDLIALVDMQLGAARSAEEALPLWRQRVALLEDLAVIRSTPYGLTGDRSLADASTGDVTSL
ncbi:MAG TPA: hypothetical protein VMR06_14070 [Dokdonella sp.]|uniref:hypothetical protein n=1 Tax=Dokdonella sp. TaxID=2291710 RepID=UPI002C629363|nr:hypothetical protein [Dokdonella sp.]HUD43113.1 hypothetical protein [Dokdonella sp.]